MCDFIRKVKPPVTRALRAVIVKHLLECVECNAYNEGYCAAVAKFNPIASALGIEMSREDELDPEFIETIRKRPDAFHR